MLVKENSVLVVIDIQDVLMPKSEEVAHAFIAQAAKLIRVARALDIPVVVTEQNPERLGGTHAVIRDALGEVPALPKLEFGCMANPGFREALARTGRNQMLLIGMETHVCVMQTALEAMAAGYEVFLVRDAVVSARKRDYKAGIHRMIQEGVVCVCCEMVIFEWLRKAGTPEFRQILPLIKS